MSNHLVNVFLSPSEKVAQNPHLMEQIHESILDLQLALITLDYPADIVLGSPVDLLTPEDDDGPYGMRATIMVMHIQGQMLELWEVQSIQKLVLQWLHETLPKFAVEAVALGFPIAAYGFKRGVTK